MALALSLVVMMPATTLMTVRAAAQKAITVTKARRVLIPSENAAPFVSPILSGLISTDESHRVPVAPAPADRAC